MKKLLLIGPTHNPIHLTNFYNLVQDYFDDVRIVADDSFELCRSYQLSFSLKNPITLFKNVRELRKIIYEYEPTVIQVHQANSYALIANLANKRKFPLILTTWGSDVLLLPKRNLFYKMLVKYSLRKSDYLTANANFMAEAIKKLVDRPVLVANYGIDYKGITLPINKEKIIYSNRFHTELYRIVEIVNGFSKFVKNHPDWKLIVAGNGPLTSELKSIVKEKCPANSVEFVGFVSSNINKENYLKSTIWVSFPISDGTAISLYESMGYGCIPVTSNLPATKEVIKHNENGIIVDNDLEKGFEQALTLELEKVQELNQKIIIKTATKDVNKVKFESIYNEIHGIK